MRDREIGTLIRRADVGAFHPLQADWRSCLPWLVFASALFVTTGISAWTVGLSSGDRWGISEARAESLGLDVTGIDAGLTGSLTYWLVWLVPFALTLGVGSALLLSKRAAWGARSLSPAVRRGAARTFGVASCLFMAAWAWAAYRYGLLSGDGLSSIVESWSGDLQGHYAARINSFQSVDFLTQCIVYQGLPALWIYGLLACVHPSDRASSRMGAMALCIVMTALYAALVLAAHQKALLANLTLLGCFGCVAKFGPRSLGWIVVLLLAIALIVHVVMSSMIPGWTIIGTVDHITGRTGDAYPFAVLHGQHQVADGRGVPYWTVGVPVSGVEIYMNRVVGDVMFPGVEAFVALAAPSWAFASDGFVGWSIAVALLLAVLSVCGQLWRWRMPWEDREVLGVEGMFVAYYLTQVPFVGLVWWSYSFLMPLAVVLLVRQLATLAGVFATATPHRGSPFGKGAARRALP